MKILNESLNEYRSLNEISMRDISKFFKKVGKFFTGLINNKPAEAQLPVNIALAQTNNSFFSMISSGRSLEMAPELSSTNIDTIIDKLEKQKEGLDDQDWKSPVGLTNISEQKQLVKLRLIKEEIDEDDNIEYISLDHPDKNVPNINAEELMEELQDLLYYSDNPVTNDNGKQITGRNLVIWGAPGTGKTEIVRQCLKVAGSKRNILVIQLQNMRADEWFIPYVDKDGKGNLVYNDIKKSWLPAYKETKNADEDRKLNYLCNGGTEEEDGPGGLLFFDEISRADGQVQGSVMNLINDGRLDQFVMGDKWVIMTAANRPMDDPDTTIKWSTALGDRVNQYNYIPTFKHWSEWAISALINPAVINFLNFAPAKMFYGLATGDTKHGPSPRSWEEVSDILAMIEDKKRRGQKVDESMIQRKLGSAIGNSAALHFITFFKLLQLYPMDAIEAIWSNPQNAPMPYKKGSNTIKVEEANALISTAITYMQKKPLTPKAFANFAMYLVLLDNNAKGSNAGSIATMAWKMIQALHPDIKKDREAYKETYKQGIQIYDDYYL